MSNLDNLTSKIISDAEEKKKEILEEANLKALEIKNKKIEEANKKASSILAKAEVESKSAKERVISKTDLDVRNKKLSAKQDLISKVFDLAVDRLKSMSDGEFESFIKDSILSIEVQGDEEILLNEADKNKLSPNFLNEINQELKAKGINGNLSFGSTLTSIDGGFILNKNGVEINYSFYELVNSLRYELEYKVGNELFNE